MRPTFGRKYIENEFKRIEDGLSEPLTVYLIGGGAMSLRDLKGATKDIDLVVPDGDVYGQLWDDGALSLENRKEITSEVSGELFHLRNSVEKHRPEEEYSAIRERIAQTKERIEKTAWQLEQLSSPKAASYLRRGLDSMVTFAEYATDGFRCCEPRTVLNEQWMRSPSGASVTGCDGARRD